MKNIVKYIIVSLVTVLLFTGCEEWLDVNTDPNAIVDSPAITENIYLIGVESEWVEKISDPILRNYQEIYFIEDARTQILAPKSE